MLGKNMFLYAAIESNNPPRDEVLSLLATNASAPDVVALRIALHALLTTVERLNTYMTTNYADEQLHEFRRAQYAA